MYVRMPLILTHGKSTFDKISVVFEHQLHLPIAQSTVLYIQPVYTHTHVTFVTLLNARA